MQKGRPRSALPLALLVDEDGKLRCPSAVEARKPVARCQSRAAQQLIGPERIERAFHLRGWRGGRAAFRSVNSSVGRFWEIRIINGYSVFKEPQIYVVSKAYLCYFVRLK